MANGSFDVDYVAPYVGAWIETGIRSGAAHQYRVAPYVGAWIETPNITSI